MAKSAQSRNPLVSLLIARSAIGFAAAAVLVAAIVIANPNGLGALLHGAPFAAALLWVFSGLTFASVQTAVAVMALADEA